MSAFPIHPELNSPTTPKKRVAKAKAPEAKIEARTYEDVRGEMIAGSSYAGHTGWAKALRIMYADGVRLRSGALWWDLVLYLVEIAGRNCGPNQAPPDEIEFSKEDIGLLAGCTVHAVNDVLAHMVERDMAIVRTLPAKRCVIRLMFMPETIGRKHYPGWSAIAEVPYGQWLKEKKALTQKQLKEIEEDIEDFEEETQGIKRGTVKLTKAPKKIRPGHDEKALPVKCGVQKYRMALTEDENAVDVTYTAEVHSGELVTTVCVPKAKERRRNADAKPANSTSLESAPGSIDPQTVKLPTNEGSQNSPHTRVNPRAAEVAALFDPLCKLSNSKILSGDLVSLRSACEAAGDIPRKILTAFVLERGERPISGPRACVAIVKEAVANWQAGGDGYVSTDNTRGTGDERAKQVIAGLKSLDEMRRRGRG